MTCRYCIIHGTGGHRRAGLYPDHRLRSKDFSKLQIAFTSNLGTNAGVMAANGLGYPVSVEGAAKYWREDILVQRRISSKITTSTVIAWRRNIPYSLAVRKMIEEINAFRA